MSSHTHHTRPLDAWTNDILPRLPADLDAQAYALGAFQRARAFASPSDLLRGLLAYALDNRSLTQLGIWGVLSGVADLAPSSWLERLHNATPWLRWLCGCLLAAPVRPRWLTQRVRGHLYLVDATTLGLAQGPGDAYRLHLAYDLLAGLLDQLHLSERTGAESLTHFRFAPGDVVVADSGYDNLADIAHAHSQGAAVAIRVYLPSVPLQHRDGRPLDLVPWLERAGNQTVTLEQNAQVVYQGQVIPVRVIAARLPRDRQGAALRRFGARARRKGREATARGMLLATWLVVITTLDAMVWTPADVVALYRVRWQVELRIKRLKQLVTGNRLRARTARSGEALLWAQLVGWALHESTAAALREPIGSSPRRGETAPATSAQVMSTWQVSGIVLDTLRQAVRGSWDLERVRACWSRLQRYLVSRRPDRQCQEVAAQAWLRGDGPPPGITSGFV